MLPKSTILEAITALGGQPDPHQTSVRLHSQLRKLEVKDALAKASETQLDNLCRKHGIAAINSRKGSGFNSMLTGVNGGQADMYAWSELLKSHSMIFLWILWDH